jgi:acyl carrier protein
MANEEIVDQITIFIRESFLDGDPLGELNEKTPLLEWGVLNSINIVRLISFIRDEFDMIVPPSKINAQGFRNIRSISALVAEQVVPSRL